MKLPEKINTRETPSKVLILYACSRINDLIDYLAEKFPDETWICEHCQEKIPVGTTHDCGSSKTITLPKPEWWKRQPPGNIWRHDETYQEALEAASKASGILFKLED